MIMMTLPAGIIISFVFATLVAALITYFYINHLKSSFKESLYFQITHNKIHSQIIMEENNKLNKSIQSLKVKNKLLSSKNKIKNKVKRK